MLNSVRIAVSLANCVRLEFDPQIPIVGMGGSVEDIELVKRALDEGYAEASKFVADRLEKAKAIREESKARRAAK